MKTLTVDQLANFSAVSSRLVWLLEIRLSNGEIKRVTTYNEDVLWSSVVWSGTPGVDLSPFTISSDGTSAALDATFAIEGNLIITEADLRNGIYGGAEAQLYILDADNRFDNAVAFIPLTVGEVNYSDSGQARLELLGLIDKSRDIGVRIFQAACPHQFGDAGCTVPVFPGEVERATTYVVGEYVTVRDPDGTHGNRNFRCTTAGTTHATTEPSYNFTVGGTTVDGTCVFTAEQSWTRTGIVSAIPDRFSLTITVGMGAERAGGGNGAGVADVLDVPVGRGGTDSNEGGDGDAMGGNEWFTRGLLWFTSGANAGLPAIQVRKWTEGSGVIGLWTPPLATVEIGDEVMVMPGCDKSLGAAGCARYDNVRNYGGFPHLPSDDFMFGSLKRPAPLPPLPHFPGVV